MGLWSKIKRAALTDVSVLLKGMDSFALDDVERVLAEADFGSSAIELAERMEGQVRRGALKAPDAVREWLQAEIGRSLPAASGVATLDLGDGEGPGVILVIGVNGVGKTTFIARLAHRLQREGKRVLVAAADTFRAGASEQLQRWAERLDVPCVTGTQYGDPAAVAYDAIEAARARGIDVVLIDTAGRLHTQDDLMEQLKKVARVIGRRRKGAPHETLLVLDGTVGQNAIQQGRAFAAAVPVTGVVITKLDGTARGGAVIRVYQELGLPIRFIGVGEGQDDLEDFDPERFADRLLGD